jgi:hypothetical protein
MRYDLTFLQLPHDRLQSTAQHDYFCFLVRIEELDFLLSYLQYHQEMLMNMLQMRHFCGREGIVVRCLVIGEECLMVIVLVEVLEVGEMREEGFV